MNPAATANNSGVDSFFTSLAAAAAFCLEKSKASAVAGGVNSEELNADSIHT